MSKEKWSQPKIFLSLAGILTVMGILTAIIQATIQNWNWIINQLHSTLFLHLIKNLISPYGLLGLFITIFFNIGIFQQLKLDLKDIYDFIPYILIIILETFIAVIVLIHYATN